MNARSKRLGRNALQKGFTLIELAMVIALIAILAIAGIPIINSWIVKGKVEPTAKDIAQVASIVRGNYAGTGANPYSGITTSLFAQTAKGAVTSMSVSGTSTFALSHDLGATGGALTAAAVGSGAGFSVTVPTVNNAGCPGLANVLSKAADTISVNGTSVKASGGNYAAATAQGACLDGDSNSFVFTFN